MSFKYLPYNSEEMQDYERCLLSSYINGADIGGGVTEKSFSCKKHETIFLIIHELKDSGIELNTIIIKNELQRRGRLAAAGGDSYIADISGTVPTTANTEFYEKKVIEAYRARRLARLLDDAKTALETGGLADNVIETFSEAIAETRKTDGNRSESISYSRTSAADILKTEYPDVSWVAVGVIPEGLTIICGGPKVGKSWEALHLGTAVSSGGCFMGCCQTIKGEVLYLALEDTYRRIKSRLYKQQGTGNNNFFIETPGTWKGGIAGLKKYLNEFPNTKLVIIDTLFKFNPINDTNSYSDTYSALSEIQKIAQRTPVVLVHHTRKGSKNGNGSSWAEDGMGSHGINSACDTVIVINKPDGEVRGTMTIKGRDIEEKRLNIIFDKDICTWRITGEGNFEKQEPAKQAALIKLLQRAGPEGMKTSVIAMALGKTNSATINLLKALEGKGKIIKTGHGIYAASNPNESSQVHECSQVNSNEYVNNNGTQESSQVHTSLRGSEHVNFGNDHNPANSGGLPEGGGSDGGLETEKELEIW